MAKDVMLDVGLTLNDEQRTMRLLTADGKDAEIRVAGLLRLVVVPTIRPDGRVHLAAQIYAHDRKDFVLMSEPQLVTENNTEVEVVVSSELGGTFKILITPHIQ